jgi:hypothetical protein
MEQYFKRGKEVSSKEDVFLFKNMRMSITELG